MLKVSYVNTTAYKNACDTCHQMNYGDQNEIKMRHKNYYCDKLRICNHTKSLVKKQQIDLEFLFLSLFIVAYCKVVNQWCLRAGGSIIAIRGKEIGHSTLVQCPAITLICLVSLNPNTWGFVSLQKEFCNMVVKKCLI